MEVSPPPVEVAEIQIKAEEKQRVLGAIPNFYVTYAHHPVPLDSKQKFELAWRVSIDPITFVVNGAIAGVEQADDDFEQPDTGKARWDMAIATAPPTPT